MVTVLAQLVVDGLAMGLVYVLLASGINLIIAISGILFIAYGELYMLGAYILWGSIVLFKLPFILSLCIATIIPAMLGGLVYKLIFHRIQFMKRRFLNGIVAAIGLMLLIKQSALLAFGTSSRGVPSFITGMLEIGGINISIEKIILIVLTLFVLVGLHLLIQKTNVGRAMRAVSYNPNVAALQGVNPTKTYQASMIIGGALAGFAGGVMAPVFAIYSGMGVITLLIFLVVMLGGIGSMLGAIIAGLILGMTLSFGQYFVGSAMAQIIFFAVIGVIIFFRPRGLLGQSIEEKPL